MRTLTVAVGSKNPAKVNSVREAFAAAFPACDIACAAYDVPSGVPDQPWGGNKHAKHIVNATHA